MGPFVFCCLTEENAILKHLLFVGANEHDVADRGCMNGYQTHDHSAPNIADHSQSSLLKDTLHYLESQTRTRNRATQTMSIYVNLKPDMTSNIPEYGPK